MAHYFQMLEERKGGGNKSGYKSFDNSEIKGKSRDKNIDFERQYEEENEKQVSDEEEDA